MRTSDPPSLLGFQHSPHPQEAATSQAAKPPSKPGGPVRSRFLPCLQLALAWVASRSQGQGWCVGNAFTPPVPSRGWRCPWKPLESSFLARKMSKAYMAADTGAGVGREAGRARRPPCKPRSYKMHFPTYPSGLSEPLLLTALFIDDRQLINIQTS